jgi:MFS family permease
VIAISSLISAWLFANTFRAFRHRDYFIYWLGLLLGHTGTLIQTTAQSWLIFQLTDSPFYLGLEGLCLGLPRVLFSAFGGAVVDRSDRKTIFVITQSAFFLMALFLGVMQHLELVRVWHLLLVSALTGLLVSFEQPVRQSILHHLWPREDLPNAVTLYQMVFNGSMLFGPSIGGLLIPWIDTKGCFFVSTIGNLLVLLTIFVIHIARAKRSPSKTSLTRDMLEGFSLAWHTPIFLALLTALAIVSFCTNLTLSSCRYSPAIFSTSARPASAFCSWHRAREPFSADSLSRQFAAFLNRTTCCFHLPRASARRFFFLPIQKVSCCH